jgi:hypothetical protein
MTAKFWGIRGVGMDAAKHIYVAMSALAAEVIAWKLMRQCFASPMA